MILDWKKHSWRYDQVWPRLLFSAGCFGFLCFLWLDWFGKLPEQVKGTAMFLAFFAAAAGAFAAGGALIRPESKETAQGSGQAGDESPLDKVNKYQALTARLYSRESSTLTIATFMAAVSLTVLAIALQGAIALQDQIARDPRIWLMGIAFACFGIFYRELTVFTIDRKTLRGIREIEHIKGFPQLTNWDKFFRALRWFVFRCAMLSPAAGLIRFGAFVDQWVPNPFVFLSVCLLYPVIIGFCEYWWVDRDRPINYSIPASGMRTDGRTLR